MRILQQATITRATPKLYTDMGLLTCDEQICSDVQVFFYALENEDHELHTTTLIAAPTSLKPKVFELIRREKEHALAGRPSGNCCQDELAVGRTGDRRAVPTHRPPG